MSFYITYHFNFLMSVQLTSGGQVIATLEFAAMNTMCRCYRMTDPPQLTLNYDVGSEVQKEAVKAFGEYVTGKANGGDVSNVMTPENVSELEFLASKLGCDELVHECLQFVKGSTIPVIPLTRQNWDDVPLRLLPMAVLEDKIAARVSKMNHVMLYDFIAKLMQTRYEAVCLLKYIDIMKLPLSRVRELLTKTPMAAVWPLKMTKENRDRILITLNSGGTAKMEELKTLAEEIATARNDIARDTEKIRYLESLVSEPNMVVTMEAMEFLVYQGSGIFQNAAFMGAYRERQLRVLLSRNNAGKIVCDDDDEFTTTIQNPCIEIQLPKPVEIGRVEITKGEQGRGDFTVNLDNGVELKGEIDGTVHNFEASAATFTTMIRIRACRGGQLSIKTVKLFSSNGENILADLLTECGNDIVKFLDMVEVNLSNYDIRDIGRESRAILAHTSEGVDSVKVELLKHEVNPTHFIVKLAEDVKWSVTGVTTKGEREVVCEKTDTKGCVFTANKTEHKFTSFEIEPCGEDVKLKLERFEVFGQRFTIT